MGKQRRASHWWTVTALNRYSLPNGAHTNFISRCTRTTYLRVPDSTRKLTSELSGYCVVLENLKPRKQLRMMDTSLEGFFQSVMASWALSLQLRRSWSSVGRLSSSTERTSGTPNPREAKALACRLHTRRAGHWKPLMPLAWSSSTKGSTISVRKQHPPSHSRPLL